MLFCADETSTTELVSLSNTRVFRQGMPERLRAAFSLMMSPYGREQFCSPAVLGWRDPY
jgi:hypothetical protein